MLFRDGIELDRKGLHDSIAEAYYIAAVWNIVAPHVAERRLHPAVYRLKCAYSFGFGKGLTPEESRLINHPESLVERKRNHPVASLQCDQAGVFSMAETMPKTDFRWPGDHSAFLKQCVDLALE